MERALIHSLLALCILWLLVPPLLDAQTSTEWALFEEFLVQYKKDYQNDSTALQQRFSAFQASLQRQQKLNAFEAENGGTAMYGVNKFSDLTPEEFQNLFSLGVQPPTQPKGQLDLATRVKDLPRKFNWRRQGVINAVRNQERCGSCWAFAVVETIESRYAIEHPGNLLVLSPQQLIACDYCDTTVPECHLEGCHGGVLSEAFETVRDQNMTIVKDSVYPFSSKDGKEYPCKTSLPNVGVQLKSYNYSVMVKETDMQFLLHTYSPLTTSANAIPWQDYIGGIIQHHCTSAYFNHAVQVVGYDLTGIVPFWIVRNTWGTDWGEDGYVRIKFGANVCGIANQVAAVTGVVGVNL